MEIQRSVRQFFGACVQMRIGLKFTNKKALISRLSLFSEIAA